VVLFAPDSDLDSHDSESAIGRQKAPTSRLWDKLMSEVTVTDGIDTRGSVSGRNCTRDVLRNGSNEVLSSE
jgi:hypothetical protein